jgi:hypothetical protein
VVVIPSVTVPKGSLAFGAGALFFSLLGAGAAPTNTVAGSVFTDAWAVAWNLLGVTREGHTLNVEYESDTVEAAEYLDPLLNVITSRTIGMEVDLMQVHLTNFKRVFNGGTLTPSGAGATLLTTYTLPKIGQEVRCQLGWEASDFTERWWGMQCFQVGEVSIQRRKGADNASLPVTFNMEPDGSGEPIYFAAAGTTRG